MIFLAAILTALMPFAERTGLAVDSCDAIEYSLVYDELGQPQLSQMIFWERREEKLVVKAWRLWRETDPLPTRNYDRGGWSLTWNDGDLTRVTHAKMYRQSWEQYDPEYENRSILSKHLRRGLSSPRE